MFLKKIIALAEPRVTVTSLLPVFLSLAYSLYRFRTLALPAMLFFLIACWTYNCFIDSFGEYNDFKRDAALDPRITTITANRVPGISLSFARWTTAIFLGISILFGLLTALWTGSLLILILGFFCYLVGIFYSWGPLPINELPVGEPVSGITMGYFIFLIGLLVNAGPAFHWGWAAFGESLLIAAPNILLISNVMLANNTSDLAADLAAGRRTIVAYIGKKTAVGWWLASNILSYLAVIAAVLLGLLPVAMLAIVLTLPLFAKLARPYLREQIKHKTFANSPKFLVIFLSAESLLLIFVHLFT